MDPIRRLLKHHNFLEEPLADDAKSRGVSVFAYHHSAAAGTTRVMIGVKWVTTWLIVQPGNIERMRSVKCDDFAAFVKLVNEMRPEPEPKAKPTKARK